MCCAGCDEVCNRLLKFKPVFGLRVSDECDELPYARHQNLLRYYGGGITGGGVLTVVPAPAEEWKPKVRRCDRLRLVHGGASRSFLRTRSNFVCLDVALDR
jgi:hypothetical protein